MKTSILIAALIVSTSAAMAGDLIFDLGTTGIKVEAVPITLEFLATQVLMTTEQVEMVDPDDGHLYYVSRSVVVSELPQEKLVRIIRADGINGFKSALAAFKAAEDEAAFRATLVVLADPMVAETVEVAE
jgi:hypothetical protein